jgi:hypothetical protein
MLFKDSYQDKISYLELVIGLGLFVGTIFASFFYDIGGYTLPFFINVGLTSITIPLTIIFIPTN